MNDQDKTREQLLAELTQLRQQVADQQALLARSRQAEAALRESEVCFRKVFEDGPLGVVLVDLGARIQQVNRRFCEMLGYSEEEIIERGIRGITHPDDWQADRNLGTRLCHGEIPSYTIRKRYLRKDGQVIWGQLVASLLHDTAGRPAGIIGLVEDVTIRKQSEEDLLKSERRLNTLMANLPGAVYRCKADRDWTVEFLSDGYYALTGYAPAQLIGRPGTLHSESIHADDRQREFDVIQRAISEKRTYQVEYRFRTASGQERWFWEQGMGVFSDSGELQTIEGFTTDITDRKRAEEGLQKANERLEDRVRARTDELTKANERLQAEVEERRAAEGQLAIFRRFVEAATQGFGMADVAGNIIYVNPFLAQLFGAQTPAEVIGQHVGNYYPPEYVELREREIIPALRRKEAWHGEQAMTFADGKQHQTIHTIFPVREKNGENFRVATVITDVSDLKQIEEALRQSCAELRASQERFELVVRAAGVGIWDWDIRTGKVYFAPRWKMLFGYDEHEVGEGFEDWASRLHPDERESIIKRQEEFLAGTAATATAEYRLRHKDGSYRWIRADVLVVRDAEGRPCRLVGSHGDITDRKQAEEELKAKQQALRRMVLASDRERHLITYELHDGVAQQLLGAMMHLRAANPADGRTAKATSDAYREGMDALRNASLELRRVMDWLRTPVLDRFGVVDAIEDVVSQLRLRPKTPKIEYHHKVEFHRLEPTLENSLFRIAQEALNNACRHSQSQKVRVTLTQKGDQVTLEVRDWGIGFDQNSVAKNRFGLEGIRERARLMGGKLTVKSKPGEGTVLRVKFPVIEAPAEAQQ